MPGKFFQGKRLIFSGVVLGLTSLTLYGCFIFTFSRVNLNNSPLIHRFVKGLVWKGGYTLPRFRDFNPDSNYDILVFGSSTANRSINPEVFARNGISVYNLGTDDQTPMNTEVLVKHYVRQAKPGLVILDIYDWTFCQSSYASTADFIQNGNSNSAALKMAWQLRDIRSLNMMAVRLASQDLAPVLPAEDTLISGFRPVRQRITKFKPDNYRYQSNLLQLKAFERTITFLKKEKVKVLLTVHPRPVYYMKSNHIAFMKDLSPLLEKHNLNMIELSMHETGLIMSDFADMAHLNKYGAEKYSQALFQKITNRNLIADN